jgi:hypothetical protein
MTAADDGAQKKGRVTGENSRAAWLIYFGWCASSTVERQRGRTDSRGTERRRGGAVTGGGGGGRTGIHSTAGLQSKEVIIFSRSVARGLIKVAAERNQQGTPSVLRFVLFSPQYSLGPPPPLPPPITAPPSARLPRGLIV